MEVGRCQESSRSAAVSKVLGMYGPHRVWKEHCQKCTKMNSTILPTMRCNKRRGPLNSQARLNRITSTCCRLHTGRHSLSAYKLPMQLAPPHLPHPWHVSAHRSARVQSTHHKISRRTRVRPAGSIPLNKYERRRRCRPMRRRTGTITLQPAMTLLLRPPSHLKRYRWNITSLRMIRKISRSFHKLPK